RLSFFRQNKQLGTADAVKSAQIHSLSGTVLICNGDHPLITGDDYKNALDAFKDLNCDLLVVSAEMKNPAGFGRILRERNKKLHSVIEEKDATEEQKRIREVNSGLYVMRADVLKELLPQIQNNNAKREYYLPDMIRLAIERGKRVEISRQAARLCRGVN